LIAVDAWVVVGAIAGIVAAVAGTTAVVATIVYGRKTDADARTAIRHERLREIRDMLTQARLLGGNTRFGECNDLCRRVAAILPQLPGNYPNVLEFVGIEWGSLDAYVEERFNERSLAALQEIDEAIRRLGTE
jgi:hypothetical protein